ncbi:hypothetical protein QQ045_008033 [Rhodiola kirilowii]
MVLIQPTNNEMALQMVHCGPVLEDDLELIVMILVLQYLPVKSLGSKGREDFPGAILAINELDNFHTFDLPELESGWPYLVTLGDSLGLVVIYKEVVGVSRMSIWVMKKLEISIPLFPLLELTVSAASGAIELSLLPLAAF